jgi:excinuclease ABC subunit C
VDWIDQAAYAVLLEDALAVLQGRCGPVVEQLEQRMEAAAAEERYEQAGRLRDQIRYLRAVTETQQVENTALSEGDVLGFHRAGDLAEIVVLYVRGGTLVSSAAHTVESALPDEELIAGFLTEAYGRGVPIPRLLVLPIVLPDAQGLGAHLASLRGGPVDLVVPRRGARRALLDLAGKNARHALAVAVEQRGHQRALLDGLAARLGLPRSPDLIECYDVSNTGRTGIVASRVVFRHGEPDTSRYRSYRIRSITKPDDYASLAEVLRRRIARRGTDPLPDLLVVDGGKGQLNVAVRVLEQAGLGQEGGEPAPALASLAKGGRRGRSLILEVGEQERVYLPGREQPVLLDRNTPEEYLLQRLRDEAHRFAIGHHRKARSKQSLSSRLDDVPGVGPVLRRRLLTSFGGTQGLARASVGEVAAVRGIGPALARTIVDYFGADGD